MKGSSSKSAKTSEKYWPQQLAAIIGKYIYFIYTKFEHFMIVIDVFTDCHRFCYVEIDKNISTTETYRKFVQFAVNITKTVFSFQEYLCSEMNVN